MNRSSSKIHRYAKAMIDVAWQSKDQAALCADLAEVRRWLAESPAFHVFAACDRLGGREVRLRALRELAGAAGLGRLAAEFLVRVEAGGRMAQLGEMLDEFERLRRERAGIVRAEIVSARPLTEAQKAGLVRRFGVGLEVTYREDPGLLGGFVARVGDWIHDYSVSGRLVRLRRRLVEA